MAVPTAPAPTIATLDMEPLCQARTTTARQTPGRSGRHPADPVALPGVPLLTRRALLRPGEVEGVVGEVLRDVAADRVHPRGHGVPGGQRPAGDVDGRDGPPGVLRPAGHPAEAA